MSKKLTYTAYSIADRIDLNSYQQHHPANQLTKGPRALYYEASPGKHIYLLSYGVVVFSGLETYEMDGYLKQILAYAIHPKKVISSDHLSVSVDAGVNEIELTFDALILGRFDDAVNKMIMLHLAQSVALDHFNGLSQGILMEIKSYTHHMEVDGKVNLGQRQAMRFIGRTLSAKNSIAENLYILDSPEATWEEEYLASLHNTLARHFELVQRYREIDNTLKIIEDNLTVYMSYNHHRESSRLEWIIIILIVIEVLDTFITKML